ncbi:succinate dehydrogenase cytochrome b subunit [Rhodocaloribacter litoris]|uniref:succinate dehydrogenase cytochrome b subunit n=1 Tax=Rhodocaloribacter litoris TaxID=2558931 RepID=UPI001420A83E|nr:succinate dehydrogenase cytochrome b subunit [Rhodocaloribacter litoris]QXD14542.1 succinate dehydrogenase cytochrome b subunit [Rhodocaloribacter litoris]
MNSSTTRRSLFASPVGKKILTGLTGLGLTVFVFFHMAGNLTLLFRGRDAYNAYSHFLVSLGPLLYAIELGLAAFFIIHAVLGIRIFIGKRMARGDDYYLYRSAGRPSLQSFSSRSMIFTGAVLLVFLVIHLASFKFGPGGPGHADPNYVTTVDGVQMRDLAKLVIEKFQNPLYAFGYTAVMVLLGFHLRHGVWSALQSLGAMNPRLTPLVYGLGGLLAVLIAVGFLVVPLWIYFGGAIR